MKLSGYGKDAKVLAGGTDLKVLMRNRTLTPDCIIDITRIPGLDYIRYEENGLKIGVLATLRAVKQSDIVNGKYSLLYDAICQMATSQVKNRGTVAGNLRRASPAAEATADETEPITDIRSTREYREELSMVLVRRALKISWERAGGKETNNP